MPRSVRSETHAHAAVDAVPRLTSGVRHGKSIETRNIPFRRDWPRIWPAALKSLGLLLHYRSEGSRSRTRRVVMS